MSVVRHGHTCPRCSGRYLRPASGLQIVESTSMSRTEPIAAMVARPAPPEMSFPHRRLPRQRTTTTGSHPHLDADGPPFGFDRLADEQPDEQGAA
jgi:hypothetical protein